MKPQNSICLNRDKIKERKIMSKKDRKDALKFIKTNRVVLDKIACALGCDKHLTKKEKSLVVEDMISSYREENYLDPMSIHLLGTRRKGGFRNDDLDEMIKPSFRVHASKSSMNDAIDRLINK